MEKIGGNSVTCILLYLDLKEIASFLTCQKRLYRMSIEHDLWSTVLRRHTAPALSIATDISVCLRLCKDCQRALWVNTEKSPKSLLQMVVLGLGKAATVPLEAVEESSHGYDRDISLTLSGDKFQFWCCEGSKDTNAVDCLRYRLQFPAVLLWIEVTLLCVEFAAKIVYSPVQFRVKIGLKADRWDYISDAIDVKSTDATQYLIVLPAIVPGQYVEIELIGRKQIYEEDQLYYNAVETVQIFALPLNSPNFP